MPPAARVSDPTSHGVPLNPGIGSPDVRFGFKPAWRALPSSVAGAVEAVSGKMNSFMTSANLNPASATSMLLKISAGLTRAAAKAASEGNVAAASNAARQVVALNTANANLSIAWTAASATPGGQTAADKAYTEGIRAAAAIAATSVLTSIAAGVTDMHLCPKPTPTPPHGPGVVTKASKTVFINGLPAARQGDKVFEACGGSNPIVQGLASVFIGD